MKVLFVYPDITGTGRDWQGLYSHGIGALSAALKQAGHQAALLHVTRPIPEAAFLDRLNGYAPDLVAFSSTTNMFRHVVTWSRWTKAHGPVPTICGGVHPTLSPEEVIGEESIDAICLGEGEHSLVEYCEHLQDPSERRSIRGIWYKDRGAIRKGAARPLPNLDELPFPDKSLFDYEYLMYGRKGSGVFMASRGCPYQCTYCCLDALRQASDVSQQPFVRFKSVDYLIAEIEDELRKYRFIRVVGFDDDILPLNLAWFEEFVKRYRQAIHLPMACCLRPNLATESRMRLLKEAGCIEVCMGIESGNEEIRRKLLRRDISQQRILEAFRLGRQFGMRMHSFNIVGLPGENVRTMLETVRLNARAGTDRNQATIFFPYPKTELHALCERQHLIRQSAAEVDNLFTDSPLAFPAVERIQIRFIQRYFRVLVRGYEFLYRHAGPGEAVAVRALDRMLQSRLNAILLFPVLLGVFRTMMATKWTNRAGRWFLRHVLDTGKGIHSPFTG